MSSSLSDEERGIVDEEERLLAAARFSIESAKHEDRSEYARRRMSGIRSDLSEAGSDDIAAIAAEAQRVRATAIVQGQTQTPDLNLPYFAHMQLETESGLRDVLLGQCSYIDTKNRVTIVDWRAAPVAQVFFQYAEGDDYEQEISNRSIEGILRKRRILAFNAGELVQIQAPMLSLCRDAQGCWHRDDGVSPLRLEGGEGGALAKRIIGTGRSGEKLPVISSLLDEQQYDALTLDADRPLLILGGAGCGKTTVALHRLAFLAYQDPGRYSSERLSVIVPEEGLVRLTRTLLDELGLKAVSVTTVDAWFAEQAARIFPALPSKLSDSTPAAVSRLKRHSALCEQLLSIANDAGQECAIEIDRLLHARGRFRSLYESCDAENPLARLRLATERASSGRPVAECERIHEITSLEIAKFVSPKLDQERIFGERELLDRIIENANGDLSAKVTDRTVDWFRIQDAATADQEFSDVAAYRKGAVDGLSLDAGTPDEDAGSIDVEDFALLIELNRLKTGRSAFEQDGYQRPVHLVLDEAQELSEIELRVLGQSIDVAGSVTVAGDPVQQIGDSTRFGSWDGVMTALGQGLASPVTLTTSYRCTRPIIEFGHAVLGPLAPAEQPSTGKDGVEVSRSQPSSEMHAGLMIGEALADLMAREPSARVAIIAREDEMAFRLYKTLAQQLDLRLVLDGRFSFRPGIDVTSVPQVKGLEFDYVVIPDASAAVYPRDPISRRMLHVAATRAIHQLWLISIGPWSTILPN